MRHWKILVILVVALLLRLPYLDTIGHSDLNHFYTRAAAIHEHGLWQIYAQNIDKEFNYPPVYLTALALMDGLWSPSGDLTALDPTFLRWHKWLQVFFELLLIAIAYFWLAERGRLRWLIPALLAVYPGLILVSAFWGQTDTLWVLFLVLALIALNRDKPNLSWVAFTFAVLTKFQAVFVFPLLLILTFRRYGSRKSIIALGLAGLVFAAILSPFVISTGLESVLRPFTQAVNFFPTTTIWALNLWYVVNPMVWGDRPPLVYDIVADTEPLFGLVTIKAVSLLLFAVYTLLIGSAVWRQYRQQREFVWAAALGFGFFMLLTEMHERYLHAAAVFLFLAVAQDKRLWPLALGTMFTYSYNVILPTHAPFVYLGVNILFVLGDISLHVALLNLLLLVGVTRMAVSSPTPTVVDVQPLQQRIRPFLNRLAQHPVGLVGAIVALALSIHILGLVMIPAVLPANVTPLDAQFANSTRLAGYHLEQAGVSQTVTLYWKADAYNNNDYTVFVHAARHGATIAQCDERPQNGAYPTWRWFNNRIVVTTCKLNLPADDLPDSLFVGLYDANKMVNAPLIQNGQAAPDGRAILWEQDASLTNELSLETGGLKTSTHEW